MIVRAAIALASLLGIAPAASFHAASPRGRRLRTQQHWPSSERRVVGHQLSAHHEDLPSLEGANLPSLASQVRSVNYFISRKCNYACKFCFHTAKTSHHLALAQAELGLRMLKEAGTEKINFAGGEPFLNPELLGELCRTSHELGIAVSIISNGSRITPQWMQEYGQYVDVLGVSVDSFSPETNALIGRGDGSNNNEQIYRVRDLCAEQDIIFKMNTVVNKHNWEEDMMSHVQRLRPERWKVFQVLLLEGENSGLHEAELRDARPLVITDEEFWAFVNRHKEIDEKVDSVLIPEPNDVMQNSYLLLDEDMCFLDCSQGGKVPSQSILEVGVEKALSQAGFDFHMFQDRGGVYNWKRERQGSVDYHVEEGSSLLGTSNSTLAALVQ